MSDWLGWVRGAIGDIEDLVLGPHGAGPAHEPEGDARDVDVDNDHDCDQKGHVPMYGPVNVRSLRVGQYKLWCTCGLSQTVPWCDGVGHQGTPFLPLTWQVTGTVKDGAAQTVYQICACTRTKNPPFCDATHNYLPLEHRREMAECPREHARCGKLCGRCGSKDGAEARLAAVYARLAPDDRAALGALYRQLQHASEAPELALVTVGTLRRFCHTLPTPACDALFETMRERSAHRGTRGGVDELGLVDTLAVLLRGPADERAQLLHDWALTLAGRGRREPGSASHDSLAITRVVWTELAALVGGIALAALRTHQLLRSHPETVHEARAAFVTALMEQGGMPTPLSTPEPTLTAQDLREFVHRAVLFDKLVTVFATYTFRHRDELLHDAYDAAARDSTKPDVSEKRKAEGREAGLRLPRIRGPPSSLLTPDCIWTINLSIPPACRHLWRCLFNDRVNGKSWTNFTKAVISKGPTVIVVEDETGARFGGFAAANWVKSPKWRGNTSCLVFTLAPRLQVFQAGTLNDHYMYLNFGTETLPNGLGMGGQLGFCGLWLAEGLEEGHSKAAPLSTTYQSPRLSGEEYFRVERVEVWGVLEPTVDPNRDDGPSILDQFKEDQTLLEWAGREMHSKAHREIGPGGVDDED